MNAVLLLVCLLALSFASGATMPPPYPGATMEEQLEITNNRQRVILGSLKKIRNVLEPEAYENVVGKRTAITWYLPDERNVKRVAEYYRRELEKSATILFSCEGRTCGSSNYWANTVFGNSILYGPEQFQYYFAGRDKATGDFVLVYIGQRGTRKIYTQVEHIELAESGGEQLARAARLALDSRGRYTIYSDEKITPEVIADAIAPILQDMQSEDVLIVGHQTIAEGDEVAQAVIRSRATADEVRTALVARGVVEDRLEVFGVGPLAPVGTRIEVILKNRLDEFVVDDAR